MSCFGHRKYLGFIYALVLLIYTAKKVGNLQMILKSKLNLSFPHHCGRAMADHKTEGGIRRSYQSSLPVGFISQALLD